MDLLGDVRACCCAGCIGGVLGAEMLPIEPFYALRYMVTFLVVVSVGGAGSITGALAASLFLGLADTTGKYLAPESRGFLSRGHPDGVSVSARSSGRAHG